MPIIGFNLQRIEAYVVDERQKGEINVSSHPKIESVEKKELSIPGVDNVLSVAFTFRTTYEPKIGEVLLAGEVIYKTDNAKKVLDVWKKSKTMEDKMAVDVMNTLFRKCLTRITTICEDLRLPPPLTFPVVQAGSEQK